MRLPRQPFSFVSYMKSPSSSYVGRFAPSPTGPMHMGSLYTALASFLEAKSNNGQWLIRIEDIDPPREQAGATNAILKTLEKHGLRSDKKTCYQSLRLEKYQDTLDQLIKGQYAFYCDCSRQQLKPFHGFYSGHCRPIKHLSLNNKAIRLRSKNKPVSFIDDIQGAQRQDAPIAGYFNDFVIKRRDGLFAYMLAVVIDDIDQNITHIVRGSDILGSTFKQIELYECLKQPCPEYCHLPVIRAANGQKLSKQNLAPAINDENAIENLLSCLKLLRQPIPEKQHLQSISQLLDFAIKHWDKKRIPAMLSIEEVRKQPIN